MLIKQMISILLILFVFLLLVHALFFTHETNARSPLINSYVPTFQLKTLSQTDKFTNKDLTAKPGLLTFWATWCDACLAEHKMLLSIKNNYHVPIYGVLYKDSSQDAIRYLTMNGNPFQKVGNDPQGNLAIDFGIYGTPETYVIDKTGRIVYRHIGIIDQQTWTEKLWPMLTNLNHA